MIRTERLSIRRIQSADWKALQSIWTDAALSFYAQFDVPMELDNRSVSRRVKRWASYSKSNTHMFFAVCFANVLIGYICVNKYEDDYEIGYCFHSDYHRKGFAKESISGLIPYLRQQGISHLTAGTALENTPSINLLRSLGFRQIGTEKVSFYKDDDGNDIWFDGGIFELQLA